MNDFVKDHPAERMALSVEGPDNGLRTIVIAPWGRVRSRKGDFVIDDEAVAAITTAFGEHGVALPVDIEHESVNLSGPASGPRGAVGWIEKLWGEKGRGLLGLVRWSERGRALIRSEAFRYLSPVLLIRKADLRAVELHSAAITIKPAVPRMERLVASTSVPNEELQAMGEIHATAEQKMGELRLALEKRGVKLTDGSEFVDILNAAIAIVMGKKPDDSRGDGAVIANTSEFVGAEGGGSLKTLGEIAKLLGIEQGPVPTVLTAILEKVKALVGDDGKKTDDSESSEDAEIAASVRTFLELAPGASSDEVVLAMRTRDAGGASAELTAMRDREADRQALEAVDLYVGQGKILENDKDAMGAALSLARTDVDKLHAIMANATPIVPQGRTTPPDVAATSRLRVVNSARRTYEAEEALQKTTSLVAYVNNALREKDLTLLSDDETTTL